MNIKLFLAFLVTAFALGTIGYFVFLNDNQRTVLFAAPEDWILVEDKRSGSNELISYISPDSSSEITNAELKVVSVLSSESLSPQELHMKDKEIPNTTLVTDNVLQISNTTIYEVEFSQTKSENTFHYKTIRFTSDGRNYAITGKYREGSGSKYAPVILNLTDRLMLP